MRNSGTLKDTVMKDKPKWVQKPALRNIIELAERVSLALPKARTGTFTLLRELAEQVYVKAVSHTGWTPSDGERSDAAHKIVGGIEAWTKTQKWASLYRVLRWILLPILATYLFFMVTWIMDLNDRGSNNVNPGDCALFIINMVLALVWVCFIGPRGLGKPSTFTLNGVDHGIAFTKIDENGETSNLPGDQVDTIFETFCGLAGEFFLDKDSDTSYEGHVKYVLENNFSRPYQRLYWIIRYQLVSLSKAIHMLVDAGINPGMHMAQEIKGLREKERRLVDLVLRAGIVDPFCTSTEDVSAWVYRDVHNSAADKSYNPSPHRCHHPGTNSPVQVVDVGRWPKPQTTPPIPAVKQTPGS